MSSIAKYTKETFWAMAAKGVAFVFYYAVVYYLTRMMTVDVWGNWSAFLALLNIIILISDQGINAASKRYIAQARDGGDVGAVVRVTLYVRVVASLVYAAVIAAVIQPLLGWLHQPDYVSLMLRSLLLIALYGILEYFKSLFEALHRLRFTFFVNLLEHGLKFLLVIVLFRGGSQFAGIVTAFTIAVGIATAGGLFVSLRVVPGLFNSSPVPGLIRELYVYSFPIFLMSIGGFVALEIDTIMLKYLRTAYDTGIYSAAKNIVMFLPHISLALSMGIIPGLAVFDAHTVAAKRRTYYGVLGGIAGIYLIICLGLIVFAEFGLGFFFEPGYGAAAAPILVLLPFVFFTGVSTYCANLLDYRGLAWTRSVNFVSTIILNVLLNWWLIPKWGAVGAAAASSIAFAPYCFLNLWQAHLAFRVEKLGKD
jgi:O-antigen/teichoic acid export membrane protein